MREKNGRSPGAVPRLNGTAQFSPAFATVFRPARFSRSRRGLADGRTTSKITANSFGLLIGLRNASKRVASVSRLSYYVNDGRSLSMFPDESIDFVFSLDSLVHPRGEIVEAYLTELGKKLK